MDKRNGEVGGRLSEKEGEGSNVEEDKEEKWCRVLEHLEFMEEFC